MNDDEGIAVGFDNMYSLQILYKTNIILLNALNMVAIRS